MDAALLPPFTDEHQVHDEFSSVRRKELNLIRWRFTAGKNTIVAAAPGMGRSIIVNLAAAEAASENCRIFSFSAGRAFSAFDFLEQYLCAALNAVCDTDEVFQKTADEYLRAFGAAVLMLEEGNRRLILGNSEKALDRIEELLVLPAELAHERRLSLIAVIDDFEAVAEYSGGVALTRAFAHLRSVKETLSFCLCCSEGSSYRTLFEGKKSPLKDFAKTVHLDAVCAEEWADHLQTQFLRRGKTLRTEEAAKLIECTEGLSSYVLQLAWHLWIRTENTTSEESFSAAFEMLLNAVSPGFIVLTRGLSADQTAVLRAVLANADLSDKKNRKACGISASAKVDKAVGELCDLGILKQGRQKSIIPADPVLGAWLKRRWKPKFTG